MLDTASLPAFVPGPRSRVRRHPERAHYDRETVFAILDAALLCHIGYVIDGRPYGSTRAHSDGVQAARRRSKPSASRAILASRLRRMLHVDRATDLLVAVCYDRREAIQGCGRVLGDLGVDHLAAVGL